MTWKFTYDGHSHTVTDEQAKRLLRHKPTERMPARWLTVETEHGQTLHVLISHGVGMSLEEEARGGRIW